MSPAKKHGSQTNAEILQERTGHTLARFEFLLQSVMDKRPQNSQPPESKRSENNVNQD